MMRVLVACEFSGTVREAFAALGHDAWSCDLLPSERPGQHLQCDVRRALRDGWDLMIAHPPCTHLSSSGARWWKSKRREQVEALDFVREMMNAPIERIAIENPIGAISTAIRRPDQIIQPHQFGEDASKATCLWLKGLEPLRPTASVAPRMVNGRPRWANQTDSGQNRLTPGENRWALRSATYRGIAEAMARQWGWCDESH